MMSEGFPVTVDVADALLTVKDVEAILGLSDASVRKLLRSGEIESVKVLDGARRVKRSALEKYMASLPADPTPAPGFRRAPKVTGPDSPGVPSDPGNGGGGTGPGRDTPSETPHKDAASAPQT